MENNRRDSEMTQRERAIRRRRQEERRRKNRIRTGIIVGGSLLIGGLLGSLIGGSNKESKEQISLLETQVATLEAEAEEVAAAILAEEEAEAAWELEKEQWYLRLVNQANPIGEDEVIELAEIEGFYVDERILDSLTEMMDACKAEGIDIYIRSGYRDWDTQALYFGNMLEMYVQGGYSYYDAYVAACEGVAVPGESEHQLGLAVDLISSEYTTLDEGQADTDVARWLEENASDYGFILRYPEGKEDITGIMYEPWHYRYVGIEAATYIMDNDITLEEYLEM